ncbi:hypothetical protein [Paenibacillus ottowii]|uniref:hypothetical protein n=1 Tax=Paenibacillus ottowii TaxID=2315729 RepID=UPI003138469D
MHRSSSIMTTPSSWRMACTGQACAQGAFSQCRHCTGTYVSPARTTYTLGTTGTLTVPTEAPIPPACP